MDFYQKVKNHVDKTHTTIEGFFSDVFTGEKDRHSYNGWKRRKVLPRADQAIKIAKAMGITVEELIEDVAGLEYVRKIIKNDPFSIQVPDKIKDIVDNLLLLDDNELSGIRANAEALAYPKKGIKAVNQS
jgi:hypothetical protein